MSANQIHAKKDLCVLTWLMDTTVSVHKDVLERNVKKVSRLPTEYLNIDTMSKELKKYYTRLF